MNKVIRTARISSQPVVLPIHVDRDSVDLPFEPSEEATFSEEDFEAAQAQDVAESFEFTSLVDSAEVVEEEPGLTEEEVEAIVAERLNEAEARFLQEKEQEKEAAHQAGMEAGHAQGYAEGHAAGLAEGQAQSQDEIARFQAMTSKIAERWDRVFKSADMDLTQLALAVSKNVVGSVAQAQEDLILASVQDCLALVQDVKQLTICVSPQDLAIVRENRTRWQEAYERIESMAIEADESIEPGGCIVETPAGDIDGQISSRLEKLQAAILERLQGAPAESAPDVSDVVAEPKTVLDEAVALDSDQDEITDDALPSNEVISEDQDDSDVVENISDDFSQVTEIQDALDEDEIVSQNDVEASLQDTADVVEEDQVSAPSVDEENIEMTSEDETESSMQDAVADANQASDQGITPDEATAEAENVSELEDALADDSGEENSLLDGDDVEADVSQEDLDVSAETADLIDETESAPTSEISDDNGDETNLETDIPETPSAELADLETETGNLDAESADEGLQDLDADKNDENDDQTGQDGQP